MKFITQTLTYCISLIILCGTLQAQILFEENFDYPAGDSLSNFGWQQIRNGAAIVISSPGLEKSGYPLSGIGNAAKINPTGNKEVKKTFEAKTADSLYVSYLINVSDADELTTGSLYLYLGKENISTAFKRCTAYIRKDTSDMLAFGIAKNSGVSYTDYIYNLDTTHLIVMKYKFNSDAADRASLWVNPNLTEPEPIPDAGTSSGDDASELASIVISQMYLSNYPPDAVIDGLRIAESWDNLPVSIKKNPGNSLMSFKLKQNYPNPFNPATAISFQLPAASSADLSIYNVLGQKVISLVSEDLSAGSYEAVWDASGFPSGLYFYRLKTEKGFIQTRKMLLQK